MHVDLRDFLGTVIAYRPLRLGAGGDFAFPGLGLEVDGSRGFTLWCASHEVRAHQGEGQKGGRSWWAHRSPAALLRDNVCVPANSLAQVLHHGKELKGPLAGESVTSAVFLNGMVARKMTTRTGLAPVVPRPVPPPAAAGEAGAAGAAGGQAPPELAAKRARGRRPRKRRGEAEGGRPT